MDSASDAALARAALMWLSVAQRPFRAHELWIAVRFGEHGNLDTRERLLSEPGDLYGAVAVTELQRLLGTAISIEASAKDPSRKLVTLRGPRPGTVPVLARPDGAQPGRYDAASPIVFSDEQAHAHAHVAAACLSISSMALRHLTSDEDPSSPLVHYACSNWSVHLVLSGNNVSDDDFAHLFDLTAAEIARDMLDLALELSDVLTAPIALPSTLNRLRSIVEIQEVQRSLGLAVVLLENFLRYTGLASSLEHARHVLGEISMPFTTYGTNGLRDRLSALECHDRQVVLSFWDVTEALRHMHKSLSSSVYLGERSGPDSNSGYGRNKAFNLVANWMDSASRYPFLGRRLPEEVFNVALEGKDSSSPKHADASTSRALRKADRRPDRSFSSASRVQVSAARWFAASLVYKVRDACLRLGGGSVATINQPYASSFATLPSELFRNNGWYYFDYFAPKWLTRNYYEGIATVWADAKLAILSHGYRTALLQVLIAILLYHVQRVLLPGLGAYMYGFPIETLRLALFSPVHLLDLALSVFTVRRWLAMEFQKQAVDLLGSLAARFLINSEAEAFAEPRTHRLRLLVQLRLTDAAKIVYLVWMLSRVEYAFTRTASTAAFLIAMRGIWQGGASERLGIRSLLARRRDNVPLFSLHIAVYALCAMRPTFNFAVSQTLFYRRPGLLLALAMMVGGVCAILKHRSKIFIFLEMSNMFVVLAFALAGVAVLAWEFVADPLGLELTSASLRRRAKAARRAVARHRELRGRGVTGEGAEDGGWSARTGPGERAATAAETEKNK